MDSRLNPYEVAGTSRHELLLSCCESADFFAIVLMRPQELCLSRRFASTNAIEEDVRM